MQAHTDRTALITGANRGLGLQTARELARRGLRVILSARSRDKAEAAAKLLEGEGLGARVIPEVVDVASDESVRGLADRLRAAGVHVDVLVNNAGMLFEARGRNVGALDIDMAVILETINNNTLGAMRTLQAFFPAMLASGYGRVVNVSSGMGALTDMDGGWPAYRTSKTALNAVTRLFHNEARGDVKVNSVCPGWVQTDMGGAGATRTLEEGAAGIVLAALLPEDGPSGVFLRDGAVIAW
ncbi:MAG: SDR family NAD(P)-dependent oxidoreductase [Nannocystaceae bacterium]